jgi:hypothetical protein
MASLSAAMMVGQNNLLDSLAYRRAFLQAFRVVERSYQGVVCLQHMQAYITYYQNDIKSSLRWI